jgi:hypothetical protein
MARTDTLEPSLSELEDIMEREVLPQPVLSELGQDVVRQEISPGSCHSSAERYTYRKLDGRYTYRKLKASDSIRLFRLHAGVADDLVNGYLAHVSFSDDPEYEALSYCWGDLGSRYPIIVHRGKLFVSASLAAAWI